MFCYKDDSSIFYSNLIICCNEIGSQFFWFTLKINKKFPEFIYYRKRCAY